MSAMAEAMIQAGLVSKEKVAETERQTQIEVTLKSAQETGRRKRALEVQLKRVVKDAEAGTNRDTIAWRLEQLSDEYRDVFDEVATMEAYKRNLGLLRV